jgi:signal transduction histidine kinase
LLRMKIPMQKEIRRRSWFRPKGIFQKYVISFVGLAVLVLVLNGAFETWFAYRQTTSLVEEAQSERAGATARRIEQYVTEIERQISWATRASSDTVVQRRADYQLLLQQVPAITRLIELDSTGKELLRVTRQGVAVGEGIDYSTDERFTSTLKQSVWFSPVYFDGLEPYLSIAMLHPGRNAGSTVAEVDLRFLRGFVDSAQTSSNSGYAYIVEAAGRLVAHSDAGRSLGIDYAALPQVAAVLSTGERDLNTGRDPDGRAIVAGSAMVPRVNWHVFFEEPLSAALKPVYDMLIRTVWVIAGALVLALGFGTLLARQMVVPILALEAGTRQLEASDFGHRIEVQTGDEIEDLAHQFNRMADQLQVSYGSLEQKVEERTRDLAQSIRELKALEEIGRAVTASLDPGAVLATIVARAVELTKADAAAIYRYDGQQSLKLAEAYGVDQRFRDASRHIALEPHRGLSDFFGKDGPPICISHLARADDYPLKDATRAAGFNSVLLLPLVGHDEFFGALVVLRRAEGDFPQSMIDLMRTFAHQSVIAMKNASLFRQVEEKGRELAIASEHKSRFFANMSHELRTPLNSVLGYSELLADGQFGTLPKEAIEALERIQANGKHLLGLINDVLDIAKIEAGQLDLSLNDYSVEALVENVVTATAPLAQAKGIELKAAVAPDLPLAYGDERRLTQVLFNIVSNAIKFTDLGKVEVDVSSADGQLTISVQDTGPGIKPEDQARIFEEFQQVDDSSTRQKGGTGLGLSISRRLVTMHGGRIDLRSMVGVGSTFSMVLPLRVTQQREPA